MTSIEIARTLVKSQPEIWAELEDAEHLGELLGEDEITITRIQAPSELEWEGNNGSGTIKIEQSGWGTRVLLTADTAEPGVVDLPSAPDLAQVVTPGAVAEPTVDEIKTNEFAQDAAEAIVEADLSETVVEARSFWQKLRAMIGGGLPPSAVAHDATPMPVPGVADQSDPIVEAGGDEPAVSVPTVLVTEESVDNPPVIAPESSGSTPTIDLEQRLTAVLDHLGSAHKRPFATG